MSIRFRKSINLGPAFRINVSKSGLSFSAHVPGMKGLSVSTGSKGTYLNAGLPGTGLSSHTKLSGKGIGVNFRDVAEAAKGALAKDGEAEEFPDKGRRTSAAPEEVPAEASRKEAAPSLEETLRPYLSLHRSSPVPAPLDASAIPAEEEAEAACQDVLSELEVPFVFTASFEYDAPSRALMLDVDLPEIEDVPDEETSISSAGRASSKRISAREAHAHYRTCVFSLCLALADRIFCRLPGLAHIVLSGYTQRRNSAGDLVDVYIVSIRFERDGLAGKDLSSVDDPEAFCMEFENRCSTTSTGLFRKIVPYEGLPA